MSENTAKLAEPIALFDLDGTLADYDAAMRRDMRLLQSPGEPEWIAHVDDEPEYLRERSQLIRRQPGWWENLERYPPGFEILSVARELKFQCHVLTKGPASAASSWTEKLRWCQKHIPDLLVTVTQDKGLVYGKVLVDDWPAYVSRWLEWRPRGVVIMPAHSWNEEFKHPNVLRYVGRESLPEVRERFAAVRALCAD
jgi:FMN phosphatase YigB (HAD superfamily)